MAATIWTFDATQDLINLRFDYRLQFENASNHKHSGLWDQISIQISNTNPIQVSGRQCQIKWNALVHGYENIRRIRIENPEGFPLRSPNRYDIEFYGMMEDEFWLPQSNYDNLINFIICFI